MPWRRATAETVVAEFFASANLLLLTRPRAPSAGDNNVRGISTALKNMVPT